MSDAIEVVQECSSPEEAARVFLAVYDRNEYKVVGNFICVKAHAFSPHITRQYAEPGEPGPAPLEQPLTFQANTVSLVIGGKRTDYTMGNETKDVGTASPVGGPPLGFAPIQRGVGDEEEDEEETKPHEGEIVVPAQRIPIEPRRVPRPQGKADAASGGTPVPSAPNDGRGDSSDVRSIPDERHHRLRLGAWENALANLLHQHFDRQERVVKAKLTGQKNRDRWERAVASKPQTKEWNEADHPRDDDGRFGDSSGVAMQGDGWTPKSEAETRAGISKVLTKFPNAPTIQYVRHDPEQYATGNKSIYGITVNSQFMDDDKMAQRVKELGEYQVPNSAGRTGVITHEYGHILHGNLVSNHPAERKELDDYLHAPVTWPDGSQHERYLSGDGTAPSVYAMENQFEYVAEALADHILNGDAAKESSKAVGAIFDKAYGPKTKSLESKEWNEADHPRGDDGKFGDGQGGSQHLNPRKSSRSSIDPFLPGIQERMSRFYADPANKIEILDKGADATQMADMASVAKSKEDTWRAASPMPWTPAQLRLAGGLRYLKEQLNGMGHRYTAVATHDGEPVAAIGFSTTMDDRVGIHGLGSDQGTPGAGTALEVAVAKWGVAHGSTGLASTATNDAVSFHQLIGRVVTGKDNKSTWSREDMDKIAALTPQAVKSLMVPLENDPDEAPLADFWENWRSGKPLESKEWNESDHPRGEDGKFSDGGSDSGDDEDNSYFMAHRPTPGPPITNLLQEGDEDRDGYDGQYYPDDAYEHLNVYGDHADYDRDTAAVVRSLRGKDPETTMVTLYRAAPKGVTHLRNGDWVAIEPRKATTEAAGSTAAQDMPVYKVSVPAKYVRNAGDSLAEWGYFGPAVPAAVHSPGGKNSPKLKSLEAKREQPGTVMPVMVKPPVEVGHVFDKETWKDALKADTSGMVRAIWDDFGQDAADTYGVDWTIDTPDIDSAIGTQIAGLLHVEDTTEDQIAKALEKGFHQGDDIQSLMGRVGGVFDSARLLRAPMIAQQQTVAAGNGAIVNVGKQSDGEFTNKTWNTQGDEKVREWHNDADGQTVPIDAQFSVGPDMLDCPGDPAGSLENTINCRCWATLSPPTVTPWEPASAEERAAQDIMFGKSIPVFALSRSALRSPDVKVYLTKTALNSKAKLTPVFRTSVKEFDPSEPRDERGRWGSGAGGEGTGEHLQPAVGRVISVDFEVSGRMDKEQLGKFLDAQRAQRNFINSTMGSEDKAGELKAQVASDMASRFFAKYGDKFDDALLAESGCAPEDGISMHDAISDWQGQKPYVSASPDGRVRLEFADPEHPEQPDDDAWGAMATSARLANGDLTPADSDEGRQMIRTAAMNQIVANWAKTSNDSYEEALAMQDAVKQEFGLDGAAEWEDDPNAPGGNITAASEAQDKIPLFRAVARTMYDNTQDWFKKQGITSMLVHRGVAQLGVDADTEEQGDWPTGLEELAKMDDKNPSEMSVDLRPMSSWTADGTVAKGFSGGFVHPGKGAVMSAVVPVGRVIGTPFTGLGCMGESELVLLGGQDKVGASRL